MKMANKAGVVLSLSARVMTIPYLESTIATLSPGYRTNETLMRDKKRNRTIQFKKEGVG